MPVQSSSKSFDERPPALAWSRDGTLVAYSTTEGKIVIVSAKGEKDSVARHKEIHIGGHAKVDSLSFSRNDRFLACGTEAGEVIIWHRLDGIKQGNSSPADWKEAARGNMDSHIQGATTLVAFSPTESALVVSRNDQILLLRVDERSLSSSSKETHGGKFDSNEELGSLAGQKHVTSSTQEKSLASEQPKRSKSKQQSINGTEEESLRSGRHYSSAQQSSSRGEKESLTSERPKTVIETIKAATSSLVRRILGTSGK